MLADKNNEVEKLIVYKNDAEDKKPREIQQCLRTYFGMILKTNLLMKKLQGQSITNLAVVEMPKKVLELKSLEAKREEESTLIKNIKVKKEQIFL